MRGEVNMSFVCPYCGKTNTDVVRFCAKCGKEISKPSDPVTNTDSWDNPPAPKPANNNKVVLIVLASAIASVLLIGIGIWIFVFKPFGNNNNGESTPMITTVETTAEPTTAEPSTEAPTKDPRVEVPNVVGMKTSDAYSEIKDAELEHEASFAYDDSVPADYVISQSPESGKKVKKGATVNVKISKGVKPKESSKNSTSQSSNSQPSVIIVTPESSKTPTPVTPSGYSDYLGLGVSSRYISRSEILGYSASQLQLEINEMYARHGYKFKGGEYYNYFSGFSWYNPDTSSMDVAASRFNSYELSNLKILAARVKEL